MSAWATLAAVVASALFALGTALQHKAAASAAPIDDGRAEVKRNLAWVATRPVWLLGLVADGAGFGLHAFALSVGQLALVQPLMVTSLLFTLVVAAALQRRPVTRRELTWGLLTTVSLMAFLVLAHPNGSSVTYPELGPAVAAAGGSLLLVIALLRLGKRRPRRRATALGAVTGLFFGANAALVKAVGGLFHSGVAGMFVHWPLYALLVIGPLGFFINQIAFQAGPLSASLPATLVVDTLSSIGLGLLLFDETFRSGLGNALGQVATLALLAVSVILLARAEATDNTIAPHRDVQPAELNRTRPGEAA